jgi:hypothetical protein
MNLIPFRLFGIADATREKQRGCAQVPLRKSQDRDASKGDMTH